MLSLSEKQWKLAGIAAGAVVVLGLVLFTMDKCGDYSDRKRLEKEKANINAAINAASKIEDQINVLKGRQAEQLAEANRATQRYLDAVNATNDVREETNKALANMEAAKNTNTVGVTAAELEEKLRRLE